MLKTNTKISCHWHFDKKLYSVSTRTPKGWRVVRDSNGNQVLYGKLVLEDVVFKVSEAGRQRCVNQGVRNVHAHVEGTLLNYKEKPEPPMLGCGGMVEYSPFRGPYFTAINPTTGIGVPVHGAKFMSLGITDSKYPCMLGVGVE